MDVIGEWRRSKCRGRLGAAATPISRSSRSSRLAIRRAGADMIVTYAGREAVEKGWIS